ncbi:30S ribosome-binding factor RbfA [Aerococcus tenax]|uniref:30S ribosome-binding factor RbfA n=1 Tax=Aerococcus tenax TaxID=3078812 RepID=UPI0018A718A2|nr:30S ribosome-binding factor RbfA [Aerococcus tenax]
MSTNRRVERVSQEILREVNSILRKEVKDPRVKNITITDVDLTGDLQNATIYYSTLSDSQSEHEKVQKGLDKVNGLVRSLLGQRLRIYKTPEVVFKRDESIEYGQRIDQLLAQLNKED